MASSPSLEITKMRALIAEHIKQLNARDKQLNDKDNQLVKSGIAKKKLMEENRTLREALIDEIKSKQKATDAPFKGFNNPSTLKIMELSKAKTLEDAFDCMLTNLRLLKTTFPPNTTSKKCKDA